MTKNKKTTKCNKRTVTCNVGTAQYKNEIVNYEDKIVKYQDLVTWYDMLSFSGYGIPKKKGYGRITCTDIDKFG